jgi:CelD/BcsL family acetyltransferase involved in cellulose biosynthesis
MPNNLSPYRVTLIDTLEFPTALRSDWNRLAGEMPLHRWEWYQPWWQAYRQAHQQLNILVVHHQQHGICGIAPWYLDRSFAMGKSLRFLGDNEICTDYQSVLFDPRHHEQVTNTISEWLLTTGRGCWDLLDWRGKAAHDTELEMLSHQLERAGANVYRIPLENSWRVELCPTWEEFIKTRLSSGRRDKIKQLERKYFRTERVQLQLLEKPEQIDEFLEILIRLHQSRRQELGEPGCFASQAFTAYHRIVMQNFAEEGRLRLGYINLDGTPAAAIYGFVGNGIMYYYQSGMDITRHRDKPGWLCQMAMIKQAISAGLTHWDFLRGDEPYKASWGATPTQLVHRRIAAPTALAQFRHAFWVAQHQFRRWAKRTWKSTQAEKSQPESNTVTTA